MRPWPRSVFVSAIGFCLFFWLWAALDKGPWIDEAFSSYLARHDIPLSAIYAERWSADVHPPLFSFLSWLAQPLTGDDIVPKRLLNLIPLVLSGSAIAYFAAKTRESWIVVVALFAAASTTMLDTFADHRMYFAFMAALFVCGVGLAFIERQEEDYSATYRTDARLIAASIVVGLNLQFVSALFFAVILAVFIARHWFGRKRKWAKAMGLPTAIGLTILIITGLLQWSEAGKTVTSFWVHTNLRSALIYIFGAASFSFMPYIIATFAALFGIRFLDRWRLRFAITALTGVLAALAVALVLNAFRPFILRHYLFFIGPPLLVALAVLCTPAMVRNREWAYTILVSCLIGCALLGYRRAHQPQAAELADLAAAAVRQCPTTQVVTAGSWQLRSPPVRPFKNIPEATDWLYSLLAKQRSFTPIHASQWKANACPTIVWAENSDVMPTPAEAVSYLGLPIDPRQIARAVTHEGSAGFAIVYPALRSAAP